MAGESKKPTVGWVGIGLLLLGLMRLCSQPSRPPRVSVA